MAPDRGPICHRFFRAALPEAPFARRMREGAGMAPLYSGSLSSSRSIRSRSFRNILVIW